MMSDEIDVFNHVVYALRSATVKKWPFPHFYAENVFPESFYSLILDELSEKNDYESSDKFKNRAFSKTEGMVCLDFLKKGDFLQSVAGIFHEEIKNRFKDQKTVDLYNDLRLVRDGIGYEIGPHTDAAWK